MPVFFVKKCEGYSSKVVKGQRMTLTSITKKCSGPGCSKLTTSLVNVLLKFQTLISQICQYFLSKNVRAIPAKFITPGVGGGHLFQ